MGKLLHLMRLGMHAEQQFFESYRDNYDIVVLNANLVHYFSRATATLMRGKLKDKKYIIDPITHAFGHNPRYIMTEETEQGEAKIKSSLLGLANEYGSPISTAISTSNPPRSVTPEDFSPKQIGRLAENVINFQSNFLVNAIDPSERKYFYEDVELKPDFLIAPYFYMKSNTIRDWLDINRNLVIASRDAAASNALYAEIVIDRGILDKESEIDEIANTYLKLDVCDGYLLWISDFPEHQAGLSTLRGLRRLVKILRQSNKPILNLYGGYYSLLLAQFGMAGVCHGPGYGEDRDVIPVGGGMPTSKYYLTPVHQRLLFRDVQFIVNARAWPTVDAFLQEVCSGPICKEILSGGLKNFVVFGKHTVRESKGRTYEYPTTEARYLTTQHYLEAKAGEFNDVVQKDMKILIDQLKEAKKKYDPLMPGAQLRYLDTWVEAIQ